MDVLKVGIHVLVAQSDRFQRQRLGLLTMKKKSMLHRLRMGNKKVVAWHWD
jgi:hypothetical protein